MPRLDPVPLNVQLFAMLEATLFNPTSCGDLTGANCMAVQRSRE